MPTIYEIIFDHLENTQEQVNCVFHNDQQASAGISPTSQYHCFVCGSERDAGDDIGFIKNYFDVAIRKAATIKRNLELIDKYKVTENPLTQEQINYLDSKGIIPNIAKKYFIQSGSGKLLFKHSFRGYTVGYTWFNGDTLSNYNSGMPKYKYQNIMCGGITMPYDDTLKYDTLIITEGEKDMLTAKSLGFINTVAKIGGADTPLITGINFNNKNIILVYDCDQAGRDGAEQDANNLVNNYSCKVKVIDLGLQNKEDLNDYFIKYGHTAQDFKDLITKTNLWIPTAIVKESRVDKFLNSLTSKELDELKQKIANKEEN